MPNPVAQHEVRGPQVTRTVTWLQCPAKPLAAAPAGLVQEASKICLRAEGQVAREVLKLQSHGEVYEPQFIGLRDSPTCPEIPRLTGSLEPGDAG